MKCVLAKKGKMIAGILVVICLFPVFLWRAQFGIDMGDEAAYLADLNRFLSGDRYLIDDWQPSLQLTVWILHRLFGWIPGISFSVFGLRVIYVIFQFAVATGIAFFLKDKRGGLGVALVYLCFTPYNIFSISYNTLAIAMMMLCICWLLGRTKWTAFELYLGGLFFGISLFGNPYFIIIWFLYALFTIVRIIVAKRKKRIASTGLFSAKGVLWFTLGTATVGLLFLVSLIGKAEPNLYLYCIKQLFSDSEHLESGGMLTKLVGSQWIILRVYWRTILPTGIIVLYTIFSHTKYSKTGLSFKKHAVLAGLSFLVAIYTTIRFAFIYGSVACNLMIPPFMILGVELMLLLIPSERNCIYNEKETHFLPKVGIGFLAGYLSAICNYLASDTEILSMSAFLILCAGCTVLLLFEYVHLFMKANDSIFSRSTLGMGTAAYTIFVLCVFVLRMTYIFCDGNTWNQTERIESGVLFGIYTTEANKDLYYRTQNTIEKAGVVKGEKVLCIPDQPISFLFVDGPCVAPYVTRFSMSLDELQTYYQCFPEKVPSKVIFTEWNGNRKENDVDIYNYFVGQNYSVQLFDNGNVMLTCP